MKSRNRALYAALAFCIVLLGLASRKYTSSPSFIHDYAGDMLWALMVFLIIAVLFPRISTIRLALVALCFAYCIEFSQLYHAPWIDMLRQNRLGGLVLGYGFLWSDLLSYFVGIHIGVISEHGARYVRGLLYPNKQRHRQPI